MESHSSYANHWVASFDRGFGNFIFILTRSRLYLFRLRCLSHVGWLANGMADSLVKQRVDWVLPLLGNLYISVGIRLLYKYLWDGI